MSPPSGSSTLITSAPSPASTSVQNGPDSARVRSMTRSPASGRSPAWVVPAGPSLSTLPPHRRWRDPVPDEVEDQLAERVLAPGSAVHVVGRDRQHRDAGRLEPPHAEVVVLAQADHAVDLVQPGFLEVPGAGPGRHPQLVAHRDEARGQGPQRIAAAGIAEIPVSGQAEIHRPDEDGPALTLEAL